MMCFACNRKILKGMKWRPRRLFYQEKIILNVQTDTLYLHDSSQCARLYEKKYRDAVEWDDYCKRNKMGRYSAEV